MSNIDGIIAICRDSVDSAVTYDGTTWIHKELDTSHAWKFIGGSIGKFAYDEQNLATKRTDVIYTIADYSTWHGGVLPNSVVNTIVATNDTDSYLYTSYDGYNFTAPVSTHYIECSAVVCCDDGGTGLNYIMHRVISATALAMSGRGQIISYNETGSTAPHYAITCTAARYGVLITCSAVSWTYGFWGKLMNKLFSATATPVSSSGSGYLANNNSAPGTGSTC